MMDNPLRMRRGGREGGGEEEEGGKEGKEIEVFFPFLSGRI